MRYIVGCILAAAFIVLISMPVYAQDRQFMQHHTIEIEVECLDYATEIIRGLNGYNLDSYVFLNESSPRRTERWANFTRRVDYWAFRHVQEVLRDLGDVIFESENAQFLGAQITDTDVRILALSQEIERLSIMMAASDSLDVLIAIDARLSQVMLQRNNLIGTRNVLLAQAVSPVIDIRLMEIPEDRPRATPPGFRSRVADSFMATWRGTLAFASSLLVLAVRASLPVLVFAVFVAVVSFWAGRMVRRRRENRLINVAAGVDAKVEATTRAARYISPEWPDVRFITAETTKTPINANESTDLDTNIEIAESDKEEGDA